MCCHHRSGRGSYGQNFRRSQLESGPANTRHSLNNPTSSVLGSQGARQDNTMNEVNQHKGRNTELDHCVYLPTAPTAAPQPFEVLQRCPRTDLESPLNCQNKSAAKPDDETLIVQPEQDCRPHRTPGSIKNPTTSTVADVLNTPKTNNSGPRVPDTTTDCRFSSLKEDKNFPLKHTDKLEKPQNCTSRDKNCNSKDKHVSLESKRKVDGNSSKLERNEKELAKDSSVSSENRNRQPEVPVFLKTSEQSKSPSSLSHKASPSVNSQPSKSSDKTAADVEAQSQGHMHNQNADKTSREMKHSGLRRSDCTVVDEESHSQNHKWKKRDASGHGRKEEKSSSAARESSRTERSRDHKQKRPKERERSKRDEGNNCSSSRERSSNRSDSSKEYERRSTKEMDNKDEDKRSKKQADALDSRQAFSSPRRDSQRKDVYKGKSSSRIDEPSSKSKRSHCYDKSRATEDLKCPVKNRSSEKNCFEDKGIVKDRERKRGGHLEEHRLQKHGESKTVPTKDGRKNSPKKHKNDRKGQDDKNEKDKHLESVHAESPSVVAVSINRCQTSEDNSPDRKLSFMETLNLTLSPLKKQKQSSDTTEAVGASSEDASSHESRLSDAGEEFYVIDELKNSQHSDEEMEKNPEATTAGEKKDLTGSCKQSGQVVDLFTAVASEKPSAEQTNMEVQEENATESQEAVDKVSSIVKTSEEKKGKTSDSNVLDNDLSSKLTLTKESPNCVCENSTEGSLGIIDNAVVSNTSLSKTSEVVVSDNSPDLIVDVCEQQDPSATLSEETSHMEIQRNLQAKSQNLLPASNGICQDDISCSDKAQSIPKINSSRNSASSVNMKVSSSTINADLDDTSNVICDDEQVSTSKQDNKIAGETFENSKSIKTQHTSENLKMPEKSHQSLLWSQNTMAPNDSTAVGEDTVSSLQPGFLEPDSTEKEEQNTKSLNPVVSCHDEDSMMLTLRNIRVIPEPISPLTSPVRQVKKVQPQRAEKQPHVKSLTKGKCCCFFVCFFDSNALFNIESFP